MFAEQDRRQRGDEDRRRQIECDDIGERQVDRGRKERRDLRDREHDPQGLQRRVAARSDKRRGLRQINGAIRIREATARSSRSSPTE